jgi:hypothetical protein
VADAPVPFVLLAAARADRIARRLAAQIGAVLLCTNPRERRAVWSVRRGALWQAWALDGRRAAARHLARRLFTPGEHDWGVAGTPAPATPVETLRLQLRRQRRVWGSRT